MEIVKFYFSSWVWILSSVTNPLFSIIQSLKLTKSWIYLRYKHCAYSPYSYEPMWVYKGINRIQMFSYLLLYRNKIVLVQILFYWGTVKDMKTFEFDLSPSPMPKHCLQDFLELLRPLLQIFRKISKKYFQPTIISYMQKYFGPFLFLNQSDVNNDVLWGDILRSLRYC